MVIFEFSNYESKYSQQYTTMEEAPLYSKMNKIEETKDKDEHFRQNSFNSLDAQFFQSLNDFKTDFLFNKTESILAKPPHIYRQVSWLISLPDIS